MAKLCCTRQATKIRTDSCQFHGSARTTAFRKRRGHPNGWDEGAFLPLGRSRTDGSFPVTARTSGMAASGGAKAAIQPRNLRHPGHFTFSGVRALLHTSRCSSIVSGLSPNLASAASIIQGLSSHHKAPTGTGDRASSWEAVARWSSERAAILKSVSLVRLVDAGLAIEFEASRSTDAALRLNFASA